MTNITLQKVGWKVRSTYARQVIVNGEVAGLLIKTRLQRPFRGITFRWLLTDVQPILLDIYPTSWGSLAKAERAIRDYLAKAPK